MKTKIAKNEYYEAYVDEEINRTYWVMKGKWKKMTDIPDYVEHNREVARHLRSGFTMLMDVSTFEMPAPDVLEVLTEMAKLFENVGMKRQALIINKSNLKAIRASRDVMKEADMDVKMMQFGTFEDAIEWLNR